MVGLHASIFRWLNLCWDPSTTLFLRMIGQKTKQFALSQSLEFFHLCLSLGGPSFFNSLSVRLLVSLLGILFLVIFPCSSNKVCRYRFLWSFLLFPSLDCWGIAREIFESEITIIVSTRRIVGHGLSSWEMQQAKVVDGESEKVLNIK